MKPFPVIAAAVLCTGTLACAQATHDVVAAPPHRSTAPTIPDSRQVDQRTMMAPGSSAASPSMPNDSSYGNWRASDGLNADPNNPSGAPGPSSGLGTSPTR